MILGESFKQTSETTVQAEEHINPHLLSLVDVRASSEENILEAKNMIDRLNHVENSILYQTNNKGCTLILAETAITDYPEFAHLKGVVPRGHVNSWDTLPGAGGHVAIARIGHSDFGSGHSTLNLEIHEYGHMVDAFTIGEKVSHTKELKDLQDAEVEALFGDNEQREYFLIPEEYFAESFTMYYLNEDTRKTLADRAPKTLEFYNTFNHRILSVGEVTGNTVKIHWDLHEDAVIYEMYRNDEFVGTTSDSAYIIDELDIDTLYEFKVIAKNGDGEKIYTSYPRSVLTENEEN